MRELMSEPYEYLNQSINSAREGPLCDIFNSQGIINFVTIPLINEAHLLWNTCSGKGSKSMWASTLDN